jgi:hypothetical protein
LSYLPPLYYQKDDFLFLGFKKETKTRGVSHSGLAIYIEKYLNAKKELSKFKYISQCRNIIFKKKSSKRNQNPSRYHNPLQPISSSNRSQNIIFQKSSYKNKPTIYLGAKIP